MVERGFDGLAVADVDGADVDVTVAQPLLHRLAPARERGHLRAEVVDALRGREPDAARGTADHDRLPGERAVGHDHARNTFSRSDGPAASSANASGPASSGCTGSSSPSPARPSSSHASASS